LKTVEIATKVVTDYWDVIANVGVSPTWYGGLVTADGTHDIYEGNLRIVSPEGKKKDFAPKDYLDAIAENAISHNYATHVYAKEGGYPAGLYRTGPLGMINACE